MTKKVFFLLTIAIIAVSISGIIELHVESNHQDYYSTLMTENVEALADETEGENGVTLEPYDCVISGVVQIKLGNGKIIKASGDGTIKISGAQNCKLKGEHVCKIVTCDQLYSVVL